MALQALMHAVRRRWSHRSNDGSEPTAAVDGSGHRSSNDELELEEPRKPAVGQRYSLDEQAPPRRRQCRRRSSAPSMMLLGRGSSHPPTPPLGMMDRIDSSDLQTGDEDMMVEDDNVDMSKLQTLNTATQNGSQSRRGVGRSPTFETWCEQLQVGQNPRAPVGMRRPQWCLADYDKVKPLGSTLTSSWACGLAEPGLSAKGVAPAGAGASADNASDAPLCSTARARCKRTHMTVVLRTYFLNRLSGPDGEAAKAALMRSTQARLHLEHRNLVCLYGAFKEKGQLVLVEEYLEGALPLSEALVGRLSEEQVVKMVLLPVCRALNHLDACGATAKCVPLVAPERLLLTPQTCTSPLTSGIKLMLFMPSCLLTSSPPGADADSQLQWGSLPQHRAAAGRAGGLGASSGTRSGSGTTAMAASSVLLPLRRLPLACQLGLLAYRLLLGGSPHTMAYLAMQQLAENAAAAVVAVAGRWSHDMTYHRSSTTSSMACTEALRKACSSLPGPTGEGSPSGSSSPRAADSVRRAASELEAASHMELHLPPCWSERAREFISQALAGRSTPLQLMRHTWLYQRRDSLDQPPIHDIGNWECWDPSAQNPPSPQDSEPLPKLPGFAAPAACQDEDPVLRVPPCALSSTAAARLAVGLDATASGGSNCMQLGASNSHGGTSSGAWAQINCAELLEQELQVDEWDTVTGGISTLSAAGCPAAEAGLPQMHFLGGSTQSLTLAALPCRPGGHDPALGVSSDAILRGLGLMQQQQGGGADSDSSSSSSSSGKGNKWAYQRRGPGSPADVGAAPGTLGLWPRRGRAPSVPTSKPPSGSGSQPANAQGPRRPHSFLAPPRGPRCGGGNPARGGSPDVVMQEARAAGPAPGSAGLCSDCHDSGALYDSSEFVTASGHAQAPEGAACEGHLVRFSRDLDDLLDYSRQAFL